MDLINLSKVDQDWINKELISHLTEKVDDKLSLRLYTVKSASSQIDFLSLSKFLTKIIPHYVYSINEINKEIERKIRRNEDYLGSLRNKYSTEDWKELLKNEQDRVEKETWIELFNQSRILFKKKGENYIGGKYGELMLFALVESVLGCKMIAHKIQHLTNPHDEIKGSDGIFIGEYLGKKAILFGESKIMKSLSKAVTECLDSINRFHNESSSSFNIDFELTIARKDLNSYDGDIDELYDRLDSTSDVYKEQNLIHPIILMYERSFFKSLRKKSLSNAEFNELISLELKKRIKQKDEVYDLLQKHIQEKKLDHVYLDFFLVPVEDVSKFRDTMDNQLF